MRAVRPDLVIVSGDVTQRARVREFLAFREFIGKVPFPNLIVPGNHDVSLYNPFRRFLRRLTRFRRLVESDPHPTFENERFFAIGMDTTRSFTISGGKVKEARVRFVHERLAKVDERKLRLLVCHHPVHSEPGHHKDWVDGFSLLEERVDVVLSGHHHLSESEAKVKGGSTLLVRAGTATSTRHRGETNAFNILRILSGQSLEVEVRSWNVEARRFETKSKKQFHLGQGEWVVGNES